MNRGGLYTYRAKAIAASAAAIVTVSCGGSVLPDASDAGSQNEESDVDAGAVALYGGSGFEPDDASAADVVSADAAARDGSDRDAFIAPPYGIAPPPPPPFDASAADATSADSAARDASGDEVNYVVPYGLPTPR